MERIVPTFPPDQTLIRFLAQRKPISTSEAAVLVGFSRAWVRKAAERDGVDLSNDEIPWHDVMHWMLQAWPLTVIEDALPSEHRGLLPRLLGTAAVTWRLPRYIIAALEHQAAVEATLNADRHHLTVEQYVADELHRLVIGDDTVEALGEDFRQAYFFPSEETS